MPKHTLNWLFAAGVALIGLFPCTTVRADTFTWSGLSGADRDLIVLGNWSTSAVSPPGSNDILVFAATDIANAPPLNPLIRSAISVLGLSIDNSGTYKWNFPKDNTGTRTLSLGTNGLGVVGTGTVQVDFNSITLTDNQSWNIGTGSTVNFSGALAGSFKLTKSGGGTLILGSVSASTNSGGVDVVGGVLVNARDTAGAGTGATNVYTGAIYEARGNIAGSVVTFFDGSTFRGSGLVAGYSATQALVIDTAASNVTFNTVASTDVFTLTRGLSGGSTTTLLTISGPGTIVLNDNSGVSYVGVYKITGGQVRVLTTGTTSAVFGGRPVEMAGGTLRLAIGLNSTGSFTNAPTITVTSNSGFVVERNTTANSGNTTRTAGPLVSNASIITVRSGLNMNGAQTAVLNFSSLTLNGTPTFDVANGISTDVTAALIALQTIVTGNVTQNVVGSGITKTSNGQLRLNGTLGYTGPTIINGGTVAFGTASNSIPTSAISVAAGATLELNNGVASPTYGGKFDLSGSGTVSRIGTAAPVLNLQGSAIKPGDTPTTAGILSITTNSTAVSPNPLPTVNLQKDGAKFASLTIKIVGTGGVAGTDHDQLAVQGALTGLSNANLVLDATTLGGSSLTGQTLTIVTSSTTNFTGQSFNSVILQGLNSAQVNYLNGSITVSNIVVSPVPEPATCLGFGALGLAVLRFRRQRA
jgi:fibronectin-binding autotransporter adhesin